MRAVQYYYVYNCRKTWWIIFSVEFRISLHAGKGIQYVGMLEDGPVGEDEANHGHKAYSEIIYYLCYFSVAAAS